MDEQVGRQLEVAGTILAEMDLDVVVERVLESARELTGARCATLEVMPGDSGTSRPPELGEHSRSDELAPSGDPSTPAGLSVPILANGLAFGSLRLTEKTAGARFTAADEESAATLSRFAGVAIEYARRYTDAAARGDELARTVAALEATTEITRAVAGETDLDVILALVTERGRALVSARTLWIELVDSGELVVAAAAGDRCEGLIGERIAVADTVAAPALRTRVTQRLAPELSSACFVQRGPGLLDVGNDAGLVVPLLFHGQANGALIALEPLRPGPTFTPEDQRLLEAFASCAATAVATTQAATSEVYRQRAAATEDERERWARELHDETLQHLGALRLGLSVARRKGGIDVLEQAVGEAIPYLDEGISNLRRLVANLRPGVLDELGVEAAVNELCARERGHGLEIESSLDLAYEHGRDPTRHTAEVETAIYRLVQEALTNASKHGHAKHAVVAISENQAMVVLTVRDDGDGFDPTVRTDGFGLLGMRERVQLLHGIVRIESSPGDGTSVTVSFPAQRRAVSASAAPREVAR